MQPGSISEVVETLLTVSPAQMKAYNSGRGKEPGAAATW